MADLLRRLFGDERARFLVIGGINTVLGYVLFVALNALMPRWYLIALIVSYFFATIVAFGLHRRFTFRVQGRERVVLQFLRFEAVYAITLAINALLLWLLVERAQLSAILAQALIVVVTTVVSYLGHKFFSFRRRTRDEPNLE